MSGSDREIRVDDWTKGLQNSWGVIELKDERLSLELSLKLLPCCLRTPGGTRSHPPGLDRLEPLAEE